MNSLSNLNRFEVQPAGELERMKVLGNQLLKKYRDDLRIGMSFEEFQQTAKKHKQIVKLIDRSENYRVNGFYFRYELEVDGTFIYGEFTPFLGNTPQEVTNKAISYFINTKKGSKDSPQNVFEYKPNLHFLKKL